MESNIDIARATQIARGVKSISDGYVIVAPLDHSYVVLADAFNANVVKKMHLLQGDKPGVAYQVLVGELSRVVDLADHLPESARALAHEFWPGSLSLKLKPIKELSWNLGDIGIWN